MAARSPLPALWRVGCGRTEHSAVGRPPSVQAEQIPSSLTGLRVLCLPGMGTASCSIKSSINFHFISRFLLSFLSVKNGPASGLLEPVAWLEQAPGFNFSQLSVTFCDENQIAWSGKWQNFKNSLNYNDLTTSQFPPLGFCLIFISASCFRFKAACARASNQPGICRTAYWHAFMLVLQIDLSVYFPPGQLSWSWRRSSEISLWSRKMRCIKLSYQPYYIGKKNKKPPCDTVRPPPLCLALPFWYILGRF